jgi:outer membrane protein insertion porin family
MKETTKSQRKQRKQKRNLQYTNHTLQTIYNTQITKQTKKKQMSHPGSQNKVRSLLSIIILLLIMLATQCGPKKPGGQEKSRNLTIGKITFKGNHSIKEGELKKAMRIVNEGDIYSEYKIKVGLDNIISYYKNKGFFDAKIIAKKGKFIPENNRIELTFTLEEGERAIIESITFEGNSVIDTKKLGRTVIIRKGEPYDFLKIFTSKYNISSLYAQKGYIYVEVTNAPEDSFLINRNLTFRIDEGKRVFVEDIRIEGNKGVRKAIIEREIILEKGKFYSPQKVYASQQKIYATGLFDDVKSEIKGIEEKKKNVVVIFRVLEGKTKWIAFGTAFQTPDRITLNSGWGHVNLFNNNQSLNVEYTYTFNFKDEEWGNLNINYTEPYFLSSPLKLSLHLFNEREVTVKTENEEKSIYFGNIYGLNSRLGYSINLTSDITTKLKLKKAFINVIGDYEPKENIVTNSILLAYSRDTRDNIFNPQKGILSLSSIEFAGAILKGDNHFIRYTQDVSFYTTITRRSVLASKIKIGYTVPLKGKTGATISVDERFELGGASSLRGYDESSIGYPDIRGKRSGIYLINGGEEFRFPIYKMFSGALFTDWGGLWLDKEKISLTEIKLGIGFGLRYNTVIGPLRIDYGYRLTDRTEHYKGNVYFAIGNAY